jgi:hypothetical protein
MHISACLNVNNNIKENLFSILQMLDKNQRELFSVMLWIIWKCRNNQVRNNMSDSIQTVCERANHLITSWRNAQQVCGLTVECTQMDWCENWRSHGFVECTQIDWCAAILWHRCGNRLQKGSRWSSWQKNSQFRFWCLIKWL